MRVFGEGGLDVRAVSDWRIWIVSIAGSAAYAAAFSLSVETQGAPPAQQASQAAPAAQQQPADEGGGRGGRGGFGGPGVNDAANAEADFSPKPPVLPLPPAEQAKRFVLQPGYRIEPVLADPDIQEPGAVAFDGNGRMFVLELRGYMQTKDATGQLDPVGRISRHEDVDNDGVYERHTVFVDKLVFPRFVLPFGANSVLTMESNADDVWRYTDTNNDGVAEKKERFASNFGRSGNVEHQQAFLYAAMDNWLYSTVNAFRVRWTPTGLKREPTGSNGAQWGATQDNDGKMWFQGGASGLPSYFQFPIHYGNFSVADQFEKDFEIPWGAPVRVADMQPGMRAVRMPDGSLNRVTGAAGNDIYRGDRLPADLVGDLVYGEPVGRVVRRARPVVSGGLTQLRNAYIWNEFIKSTDPLFRPVDMATAPDGTLYIADMYRGIIQEATWSGPGTYLRARIDQYALDKVTSRGRIWRVTYDGRERDRAAASHVERDAGAARRASQPPERLVARHRAAAPRPRTGQVRDAGAAADRPELEQPARALPRALDARGPRHARRRARPPGDEGSGAAHAHPGDPRERVALQGRRSILRRRLSRAHRRQGRGRRHPGDAHAESSQGREPR